MSARPEIGDIVYYFAEDAVFKGKIIEKHDWNDDIEYHVLFYHESLWLTADKFDSDPVTAWHK